MRTPILPICRVATGIVFLLAFLGGQSLAATPAPTPTKPKVQPPVEDRNSVIPEGMPLPVRVGVAVLINSAGKISEQTSSYEASFDVRYRWRDPSLAFNSREAGGDRMEFAHEAMTEKLKKIWTPRLTIANMLGNPLRTEGGLFVYTDGTVELIQRVRASLDSKYRLTAFPFDKQALSVRILSTRYTANQIDLVQDQSDINASGFKETLSIPGWTAKRMEFETTRNRGWNGDFFPEIEARGYIQRQPYTLLFIILAPFFLLLLVPTTMALYVKADVAPRMTLWGASILALIALNFTFSVRYPALGVDSLVMQLIAIGSGYQLLMIFLTVTLLNPLVADKWLSKPTQVAVIGFLRWGIPVAVLGLITTRVLLTAFS